MRNGSHILHLNDDDVALLLDRDSVVDVVLAAFRAWGRGEAASTQRVRARTGDAMASAMAAVAPPYSGGKVYATNNGEFTFVNVLFDLEGRLLCTLDGDWLTRFRTPALCALAIRSLAAPDSSSAAIIGAGRQGWLHLEMLAAELPLRSLTIYDQRPDVAAAMVVRARDAGVPAVLASSPVDAIRDAEVIVTLTQSTQPLFSATDLTAPALLCAVGATKYDRCEIGADVIEMCAAVVCDDVVGSTTECGDLIQAAAVGRFEWSRAIELRDLLAGLVTVQRVGGAPVLFETQGVALQDVAAAGLAYERHLTGVRR